jgi:16S rRNA G966 N2-methylase RsmD/transcriptional regulator with XRE-family HTH domain
LVEQFGTFEKVPDVSNLAEPSAMLKQIRASARLSQANLAQILGTSFVSVNRWERQAGAPSPAQEAQIRQLYQSMLETPNDIARFQPSASSFQSRGLQRQPTLFDSPAVEVTLLDNPLPAIFRRLVNGRTFQPHSPETLQALLSDHKEGIETSEEPPEAGMSAGKNTYTYDAHTYHTKVPPQGIAELLTHYLPAGRGLILDAFAGSGMTGVAAQTIGHDCILNEISPAACFIADRFTSSIDPTLFEAGIIAVLEAMRDIRRRLYTTKCRECGSETEILYTVWSYQVVCGHCGSEFVLWDHCRKYGSRVREHKILTEFPCPQCKTVLQKSKLQRTNVVPVMLGYKCCKGGQQETTHPLTDEDMTRIQDVELNPSLLPGFYPQITLPEGVNLRQPARHGLDRIDKFYTPRNLVAMSHLWQAIHRVEDTNLAGYLAFAFTSLYQRVTQLSEFRFWGGSGNTARFNVPYISNEANVFLTFERKARTILDHLRTTAATYQARCVVVRGSATHMDYLSDNSIDLIFTDPPFGANINYSEMNILWESWLGEFTDTDQEAIINKVQGKDVTAYQDLMAASMRECYRVLRPGHWMLLVFMNSSKEVWNALREAIVGAGFAIRKSDIFDKQHGTFKQFVSENTAGFDLVLHCQKPDERRSTTAFDPAATAASLHAFLGHYSGNLPTQVYLHVGRDTEIDYRRLYSEWLSSSLAGQSELVDFAEFRKIAQEIFAGSADNNGHNTHKD